MFVRDVMLALECCAPTDKAQKDCYSCPLNNSTDCHSELCNEAIAYIVREQGKVERLARGVDAISDAVNNLHALF